MAGHSKWKQIKHYKAATDKKRGALFTKLIREITMAAKMGGGDPAGNARLRVAIEAGKAKSLPKENIDRAIKKGTGELPGVVFEEITYEGYGPGGVAFMVQVTTDNKTRAAKDVRSAFARHAGNLASSGAVAFQFQHAGQFLVAKDKIAEDALLEVALDAGAEDVKNQGEVFEVITSPINYLKVKEAIEAAKIAVEASEITNLPNNTVPVDEERAVKLLKLIDALEDNDDVQSVSHNAELPESVTV
jgi:YebC/PmpR family DNA-binding regulatory protein